jgi:hypothetical protein
LSQSTPEKNWVIPENWKISDEKSLLQKVMMKMTPTAVQ